MAIVTTLGRTVNIISENFTAAADLSNLQYCAVAPSAGASGKMQITTPSGQGVLTVGILQAYDVDSAEQGTVMMNGISQAVAYGSFNSGIELTTNDTSGKLSAAASGDYVIAIALEASTASNQVVTVRVVDPYQKN